MNKNLKWVALQPLTGGMYLGAEKAIGHPAEFILSFAGIGDARYDKNNNFISCGNEYHLMKYLEKVNRLPNYMIFNKNMFEDGDINVQLLPTQWTQREITDDDFNDIDIVVGVPVCSGLSAATIGDDETKSSRNCNMIWLTRYTLGKIKPKIYIFENAPRLFSTSGQPVRSQLNDIAQKNGYSVLYYKTDTFLHNNAQKRMRTFVVFMRWRDGVEQLPAKFMFEHNTVALNDVFSRVLKNATQQIAPPLKPTEEIQLKYYEHLGGKNWHDVIGRYSDLYLRRDKHIDEFIDFINNHCDEFDDDVKTKFVTYLQHCKEKLDAGKNFYSQFVYRPDKDFINAVMFKEINLLTHMNEHRKLTVREYLTFMGHPQDFEMQGTDKLEYLAQIGQNVPVDTAAFIVSQATNVVNNWNTIERETGNNVMYIDNLKQKVLY